MLYLDDKFWFKIPLRLRQRYWNETDYSRLKPSKELEKEIELILSVNKNVKS